MSPPISDAVKEAVEDGCLRARAAGNRDENRRESAGRVADGVEPDEQGDDGHRILHRHDKRQHDGEGGRAADPG